MGELTVSTMPESVVVPGPLAMAAPRVETTAAEATKRSTELKETMIIKRFQVGETGALHSSLYVHRFLG